MNLNELLLLFRRGVAGVRAEQALDELNYFSNVFQIGSTDLPGEPGLAMAFVQPFSLLDINGRRLMFGPGDVAYIRQDSRGLWRLWIQGEPWS